MNSNMPREKYSVKYSDLDKAIRLCLAAGKGYFTAKSDMKSAFRNLPIRPCDHKWLVMKVHNPRDSKFYYFVDKCLLFGASISCSHFQRVSNAIQYIFQFRTNSEADNYLDDSLFIALLKIMCNKYVDTFLQICGEVQFLIVLEKPEWATQVIVFLDMLLDTVSQTISVPVEKNEIRQ